MIYVADMKKDQVDPNHEIALYIFLFHNFQFVHELGKHPEFFSSPLYSPVSSVTVMI